jgi:hypothetical protein
MSYSVEVVLKGQETALVTENPFPETWSASSVRGIIVNMLRAVSRAEDPADPPDRYMSMRGFSWVVEPSDTGGGSVITIELPAGAVVAGPFPLEVAELDALIGRVMISERSPGMSTLIH